MSEAMREAFGALNKCRKAYDEIYQMLGMFLDAEEGLENPDIDEALAAFNLAPGPVYWKVIESALSANGGEAVPVAWAVFADSGNIRIWGQEKPEAFPEAVPLYLGPTVKDSLTVQSEPIGYADPDTLADYRAGDRLHMPVYRPDASADWQDGIPVYLHPAPPSVAVPEGWKLVPVEPTDEMVRKSNWSGNGDVSVNEDWARKTVWDRMIYAAPSPDHSGDANKMVDDLPGVWGQSDLSGGETDADHIADAGKVSFVDGLGAQRMTAEECKEGIEYIIHGDNIYWPLSDDDELRLIQAACGNGEFTYPQATPSVPENDNGVSSAYDSGYLDAMLYARVCCGRLDNPENTKDYRDCARFLDLIFKSEIDEAARLRTAGDEGEE